MNETPAVSLRKLFGNSFASSAALSVRVVDKQTNKSKFRVVNKLNDRTRIEASEFLIESKDYTSP